jgi:hypothetical protein
MSKDNEIKVKILSEELLSDLEKKVNEFIEAQFPAVEILNVQFTSHYDGNEELNEYSALILYRTMS